MNSIPKNLCFNKNFMKELKEKIPTKVSELGLYFKDFGNGFVRFDGDLLKAVYIVGKINKIIEKTNFKYKNLYKGTEQSVTLKFEYINNNFIFSKIYIKSNNKDEFENYYEYRYNDKLELESKYFDYSKMEKTKNTFVDEIKSICKKIGMNPQECTGGFSKIEEKGKSVKNNYFLFSNLKKFDNFFDILKRKKMVFTDKNFDNKCSYGIKENGNVIYLAIMPIEIGDFK